MFHRLYKQAYGWVEDRTGIPGWISHSAKHLAPPDAKWWYVFGSATLCALLMQVATGVALAFSYVPSGGQGFSALHFINDTAPLGHFLRGLHYYGASAMVLMVGAHMAQVFLFGAYKFPRELNWATGVLLLAFTLVMGFTGQTLRWDQDAIWSVVVAAEQAARVPFLGKWIARFLFGGDTIGGATLTRFFALHVFIMPAFIFAFVGLHLLLVLRHGISEPPRAGRPVNPQTYRKEYQELLEKTGRPFWPDAAWRDTVFCVAMIIVITFLAWHFGAPELGQPPDPSNIDATPRPDWYLLWYFALLALLPYSIEKHLMAWGPLIAGLFLVAMPFLFNSGERSFRRRPWAVASVITIVVMVAVLWVLGAQTPWSPNFKAQPLSNQIVGTTNGPVFLGARLFYEKGCLNCHMIAGHGGRRGPDLTSVGNRLSVNQMVLRIANGGVNMPSFAGILKPQEMDALIAFLRSRQTPTMLLKNQPVQ